jgi:hypothetical protein
MLDRSAVSSVEARQPKLPLPVPKKRSDTQSSVFLQNVLTCAESDAKRYEIKRLFADIPYLEILLEPAAVAAIT